MQGEYGPTPLHLDVLTLISTYALDPYLSYSLLASSSCSFKAGTYFDTNVGMCISCEAGTARAATDETIYSCTACGE